MIITASTKVTGLVHTTATAMAAKMTIQAWATSASPRQEDRTDRRAHSSGVK